MGRKEGRRKGGREGGRRRIRKGGIRKEDKERRDKEGG